MAFSKGKRLLAVSTATVLVLALGLTLGWALSAVLTPPENAFEEQSHTLVTVREGDVEASISLSVIAEWAAEQSGSNMRSGVVTSVSVVPGESVSSGETLYSVDLVPVSIARGDVPAFRDIIRGTEGADVSQLQEMLTRLGHYHGATDGVAGPSTVEAIRSWESAKGMEEAGDVSLGEVIFVPDLPARISLDSTLVARGNLITSGTPVVWSLSTEPTFTIPASESQALQMPPGTRVEILAPQGETWIAQTAEQSRNEETNAIEISLRGIEGDSICENGCAQIPVEGTTSLTSEVVIVAKVTGLVIPTSAIVTDAYERTAVVLESGERVQISVEASARGMAVVSGVEQGTQVRVPGDQAIPRD